MFYIPRTCNASGAAVYTEPPIAIHMIEDPCDLATTYRLYTKPGICAVCGVNLTEPEMGNPIYPLADKSERDLHCCNSCLSKISSAAKYNRYRLPMNFDLMCNDLPFMRSMKSIVEEQRAREHGILSNLKVQVIRSRNTIRLCTEGVMSKNRTTVDSVAIAYDDEQFITDFDENYIDHITIQVMYCGDASGNPVPCAVASVRILRPISETDIGGYGLMLTANKDHPTSSGLHDAFAVLQIAFSSRRKERIKDIYIHGKTVAYIDCLFVNEKFRRRGIGRWLFQSLPSLLKTQVGIEPFYFIIRSRPLRFQKAFEEYEEGKPLYNALTRGEKYDKETTYAIRKIIYNLAYDAGYRDVAGKNGPIFVRISATPVPFVEANFELEVGYVGNREMGKDDRFYFHGNINAPPNPFGIRFGERPLYYNANFLITAYIDRYKTPIGFMQLTLYDKTAASETECDSERIGEHYASEIEQAAIRILTSIGDFQGSEYICFIKTLYVKEDYRKHGLLTLVQDNIQHICQNVFRVWPHAVCTVLRPEYWNVGYEMATMQGRDLEKIFRYREKNKETAQKSMVSAYKAVGFKFLEDIPENHRPNNTLPEGYTFAFMSRENCMKEDLWMSSLPF